MIMSSVLQYEKSLLIFFVPILKTFNSFYELLSNINEI